MVRQHPHCLLQGLGRRFLAVILFRIYQCRLGRLYSEFRPSTVFGVTRTSTRLQGGEIWLWRSVIGERLRSSTIAAEPAAAAAAAACRLAYLSARLLWHAISVTM